MHEGYQIILETCIKTENSSTDLADTVGGATSRDSIASMWSSHFSQLFNCVTCARH